MKIRIITQPLIAIVIAFLISGCGRLSGPSEAEAKAAFLRDKSGEWPFSGLKDHITSIEFGGKQTMMGTDYYAVRFIFRQADGSPCHTDFAFIKNPYGEWTCR